MAKPITTEDVAKAEQKAADKAVKQTQKTTADKIKAQIDRVKASDLGKAEQKAAIQHLKDLQADLKSPLPA